MKSLDNYMKPENYSMIRGKALDCVYTGHYLDVDKEELPEIQIATGALIAAMLEELTPKEEPRRIVRCVDSSRSLAAEPTWCVLVYMTPAGVRGKRFKATKTEWDSNIAFNIHETTSATFTCHYILHTSISSQKQLHTLNLDLTCCAVSVYHFREPDY